MKEKKENLNLALLFSFLVALLGSIVWGFLYSTGWFVSIVAYATAFCMFAVYLKYAKMSKLTFIWTLIWVIVLNIIATFVAIIVSASISANLPLSETISRFFQNFNLIAKDLMIDIILGTIFGVLGVMSYYAYYKKNLKEKEQKELEQSILLKTPETSNNEIPVTEVDIKPQDNKKEETDEVKNNIEMTKTETNVTTTNENDENK